MAKNTISMSQQQFLQRLKNRVLLSDTFTLQRKETTAKKTLSVCQGKKRSTSKKNKNIILYVFCITQKTVLTVQVDVVTFTPVAPQWRIVQAGAANLDAVVQSVLQFQRRPGFSKCRCHLETAERESTNTQAHAQAHKHIKLIGRMVGPVGA